MPYAPNQTVKNFVVFNGGTAGTTVSRGQYALDWIRSLGGDVTVSADGATPTVHMPFLPDNTPTPIPDDLAAMLVSYRESVIAAVAGKVWPPGSDQPLPPTGFPYLP